MFSGKFEVSHLKTDILIIGGGTAGCWAAITLSRHHGAEVVVAEKANIERSGCLAAGVNALNAYITPGRSPGDYAEYAMNDAEGIARHDLLITAAEGFNEAVRLIESMGLVILKNPDGGYAARGDRNLKINGENIKPILASAVSKARNVTVMNWLNVVDLISDGGKVRGAVGVDRNGIISAVEARAVIVATGGAAGIYRPNNPGFSRHRMWYSPFNTGAGYAMGIRAGAEMTTFEMRFIALRCKDTIAPTGTIAQGAGARQVNSLGEEYEGRYGLKTWERLHGTVEETRNGRGPCFLATAGITEEQEDQLRRAYLNMAPSQTLRWIESGEGPSRRDVEIEGTEPYIVGGHAASGYWVDTKRETTLRGLFAAGDVAGGCPQKYVTGAMAEGAIAASSALARLDVEETPSRGNALDIAEKLRSELERMFGAENLKKQAFTADQLEESMQSAMDRYAGGISTDYRYSRNGLSTAEEKLDELTEMSGNLRAEDIGEAIRILELKDRLLVAKCLIAHMAARRETRWGSFAFNTDYPARDDASFLKYVNSRYLNERFEIILRDIVKRGETYEHPY